MSFISGSIVLVKDRTIVLCIDIVLISLEALLYNFHVHLHAYNLYSLSPNEKAMPIRVFITSDNGVSVRTHMYKEVEDHRTGEV